MKDDTAARQSFAKLLQGPFGGGRVCLIERRPEQSEVHGGRHSGAADKLLPPRRLRSVRY